MRFNKVLFAVVCSTALAACGGGDSDTPDSSTPATADVADKYVGTWSMCVQTGTTASSRIVITGTKTSATTINYTYNETAYAGSAACAGSGTAGYSEQGNIAYRGTKVIGSDTVDLGEGTVTADSDPSDTEPRVEKDISLVVGNTIYFGDDDAALDASGYPNALYKTRGFIKQ